jgi:hypothetical protein
MYYFDYERKYEMFMNPCDESKYWDTTIFAQDIALMKYKRKQSILSYAIYTICTRIFSGVTLEYSGAKASYYS